MSNHIPDQYKLAYEEVCKAHDLIADFRAKLLALLPISSGAGIFLLLSKGLSQENIHHLSVVGIFGVVVTLDYFYMNCVVYRSANTFAIVECA
ncbi:hypothetical protein FHR94_000542 [Halomonas cerina]|uniref:Uncharacterized protein n=1 Tax=Halomonas cerina TaxID=447424 RepID=A0A839V5P1_9GAMM|nr:hypothetical protein [Halomonas cerina]